MFQSALNHQVISDVALAMGGKVRKIKAFIHIDVFLVVCNDFRRPKAVAVG